MHKVKFFRVGCDSLLAVKAQATVRDPQIIYLRLIRCKSGTNSTVWMKEEEVSLMFFL